MRKALVLSVLLLSMTGKAADINQATSRMAQRQATRLLLLGGFYYFGSLAQNLTEQNTSYTNATDTAPLLTTPYFVWWATWLGTAFGFTDVLGWTLDFVANCIYYVKGDSQEVLDVKNEIAELKKQHQEWHKAEVATAVQSCDIVIAHLQNANSGITEEQVIACLETISGVLEEEAETPEGDGDDEGDSDDDGD
ncbi:MAG TPA: hypothetical protein VEL47_05690 [Myxococcota bacterium]|nr:hypothetical protein [Myxococcota bacterium]